jgi:hypothetical protein
MSDSTQNPLATVCLATCCWVIVHIYVLLDQCKGQRIICVHILLSTSSTGASLFFVRQGACGWSTDAQESRDSAVSVSSHALSLIMAFATIAFIYKHIRQKLCIQDAENGMIVYMNNKLDNITGLAGSLQLCLISMPHDHTDFDFSKVLRAIVA